MVSTGRRQVAAIIGWSVVAALALVPLAVAATSPYLESRSVPYVVGGFAGIVGLSLLLLQPLLPAGYLAGSNGPVGRRWHRWIGVAIIGAVAIHVGGLYVASPADTIDALLLVSPTPFSIYGVAAMWGVLATAILVLLRRRTGLGHTAWRLIHNGVGAVVVVATVVHALQIEGAMEPWSKWLLCIAVVATMGVALFDLRILRPMQRRRGSREALVRLPVSTGAE